MPALFNAVGAGNLTANESVPGIDTSHGGCSCHCDNCRLPSFEVCAHVFRQDIQQATDTCLVPLSFLVSWRVSQRCF